VTDPDDPLVRDYRALTDVALRRRLEPEHGLFIAESAKVIRRAIAAGYRPRSFLLEPRWQPGLADVLAEAEAAEVAVCLANQDVLRSITGYRVHRGALAAMQRRALPGVGELLAAADRSSAPTARRSRVAVFDALVDHANLGAAFRSAAALGVDAVLVTPSCADPLYRRSIRVSMGTVFQVPWTRIEAWPAGMDLLRDAGYVVAGMSLEPDSITLDEVVAEGHPKLALVFGTEGHGMAPSVVRRLDRKVRIPMMGGVDSLNVAASAAVAFYATR